MTDLLTQPLILPVTISIAAGLLCFVVPRKLGGLAAAISLIATVVLMGLTWQIFRSGPTTYEFGSFLFLKIDNLSRFVLLAMTGFAFFTSLFSISYMNGNPRLSEYYAYLLWTLAASMGAVMANELILLLCCWGFLGLALYMMIGINGPQASFAAKKAFIIIGGSDCVLIFGIALMWQLTGTTRMDSGAIHFGTAQTYVAFLAFIAAAFAKAGGMPLHSWVPDCAEKAPVTVTAFLPASLDKLLGIYLIVRVTRDLFVMSMGTNMFLMVCGAATIVLAVMMALVQHDMKRLLSYHAVSQVGYMVLGIGTGTAIGIAGGLFHMLNHAIYKCCLFLCAGSVEKKAGTTDLDKLGGLATAMPITFIAFMVAAFSICGIPPLNGFASKWMVYQGVIEGGRAGGSLWIIWLCAAMLGSALTLASFVKIMHAVFLRKPSPEVQAAKPTESGITMLIPIVSLALTCIVFGVFALRLPLQHLIFPAVGGAEAIIGTWWSGSATLLLIAAFGIGGVLYFLGTVRKARVVPTYIGGEDLSNTYISDPTIAKGADRDVEVTGVDFYRTIQQLPFIGTMYALAEKKWFDIYNVGARVLTVFIDMLKAAHNGVLLRYLAWTLAGIVLVAGVLVFG